MGVGGGREVQGKRVENMILENASFKSEFVGRDGGNVAREIRGRQTGRTIQW